MAHSLLGNIRIPPTGTNTAANPITGTADVASGSTLAWLGITHGSGGTRAGTPTLGGQNMTQADQERFAPSGPETRIEQWYLLNPPTGSQTLSIPNAGALSAGVVLAWAGAGAGNVSVADAATGGGGNSTNPSFDISVSGDIAFGMVGNGANSWSPTGWTQTQIYDWDMGSFGGGAQYGVFTATGSKTFTWTYGTSDDWAVTLASFKSSATASPSTAQIAATATGVGLASGGLLGAGKLEGLLAGSSESLAALMLIWRMDGAAYGAAVAGGRAIGSGKLEGTVANGSTANSTLLGVGAVRGAIAGTSTVSAGLDVVLDNVLQGSSVGASIAVASLLGIGSLQSIAAGAGVALGTLAGAGYMRSQSIGTSEADALLLGVGQLGGTSTGVGTAHATFGNEPELPEISFLGGLPTQWLLSRRIMG